MAQAMRPPASPVGSVLSDTHSMNLGTAQALAFCRVPRKASADDTVSPARSRPPMSKTSGSKHCRPRCWTISVCAAPSSRRRRGQKRRGFAGAPTAITSAWQRGTSSRSAPTAWSALPWATRPRPCRPGGGGTRALFGTNPIAAVFPRRDGLGHGAHRRTECPDGNSAFDNSAGRNYAPDRLSPPRSCPQGRAGGSESF